MIHRMLRGFMLTSATSEFWPEGFLAELLDLAEKEDRSDADVHDVYDRAAEYLSQQGINNPRLNMLSYAGEQAGFRARQLARWGNALDLFDLVIVRALELGSQINAEFRTEAVAMLVGDGARRTRYE